VNVKIAMRAKIHLHNAILIIGLNGWVNAGEVSTFTAKYLTDKLEAKKLGEFPPENFHHYMIQRPLVSIKQGIIQSYISPRNEFFYWKNGKSKPDLLLLLGSEPHLNWPGYAEAILKLAEEVGVKKICTMGSYLADISHEIETPITGGANNKELITELKNVGVALTNYRGPTSVYSEILWRGKAKKIDVMSLWCAVPIYVKGLYPEAVYNLLKTIMQLTDLKLDLKDLKEKAESFKTQLEKVTREQPQLRDFIQNLRRKQPEKETSYIF
jgi:proteasome assembly chaperone (PAC2) family protein